MLALTLACSCFYVGGMFLNDAFDAEFDARVRPDRPIPSGAAGTREVFTAGFVLLGLSVTIVGVTAWLATGFARSAIASALALAALIVLYDCWHKENAFAPVLMALCRAFVFVTTGMALTGGLPAIVAGAAGIQLFYLIGLTYVARCERLGSFESFWPLCCIAVPFALWSLSLHEGPAGIALYTGASLWVVACLSHLGWRARINVPRAVVGLIAGIALVDALALVSFGHTALAFAAVGAFGATLALQRWVAGT
jgi:4-hydroxybenzoate polyprenyltransferase